MRKNVRDRIKALERSWGVALPPVLCLDGTYAPPALWQKDATVQRAQAVNSGVGRLLELLESES